MVSSANFGKSLSRIAFSWPRTFGDDLSNTVGKQVGGCDSRLHSCGAGCIFLVVADHQNDRSGEMASA